MPRRETYRSAWERRATEILLSIPPDTRSPEERTESLLRKTDHMISNNTPNNKRDFPHSKNMTTIYIANTAEEKARILKRLDEIAARYHVSRSGLVTGIATGRFKITLVNPDDPQS